MINVIGNQICNHWLNLCECSIHRFKHVWQMIYYILYPWKVRILINVIWINLNWCLDNKPTLAAWILFSLGAHAESNPHITQHQVFHASWCASTLMNGENTTNQKNWPFAIFCKGPANLVEQMCMPPRRICMPAGKKSAIWSNNKPAKAYWREASRAPLIREMENEPNDPTGE